MSGEKFDEANEQVKNEINIFHKFIKGIFNETTKYKESARYLNWYFKEKSIIQSQIVDETKFKIREGSNLS